MNEPIRLTVVLTHPVQYYAAWFRYIAAHCPEIDLTVLYAIEPTPAQQGVGFGVPFQWDSVLTAGYPCRVVRAARTADTVDSASFWGLDVPEIADAIREARPHVVLVPGWHSITLLRAIWACRKSGISVLYRGDTHLWSRPSGVRGLTWNIRTRFLLRLFDAYLSVGAQAHTYLRHFGIPENRITRSPHCVDNEFFASMAAPHQTPDGRAAARAALGLDPRAFVVLFLGKLQPKKRPLDLIRAMAELGPDASLLVVGRGEMEMSCRAEADRLGVRATWAGFLNQTELGRVYAAADCLAVVSSSAESWGLVVNEALATGLPCVVSDYVGCGPDLITPGETGEVFSAGDVGSLCAALERVRARRERGVEWGPACRARVAAYSVEAATAGLLKACRNVVSGTPDANVEEGRGSSPRVIACCSGMVSTSGLERMTFQVLRVLRERGARVHCIVSSWDNRRIVALAEDIGASWRPGHSWYPVDRHSRDPRRWLRLARDVVDTSVGLLRESWHLRPTHVLVPDLKTTLCYAPALFVLRTLGVRTILRLGNAPEPGSFYRRLWRWAVNPVIARFVGNSRFTTNELLSHGIPPSKVSMIYNCPPHRAQPRGAVSPRDPGRVIYIGQIIPVKGLDLLLDAIGLLVSKGYDVRLDVVGDIDAWEPPAWVGYHAKIRARAAQSDLHERVRFLGVREDVPALLAASAVHCCPSRLEQREGFGAVNIEAKAAGIPSVVCPSGGMPEVVDHAVDGWVCPEVTAEALATGIEYFIADPARWQRARHACLAAMALPESEFAPMTFARRWWAVFQ